MEDKNIKWFTALYNAFKKDPRSTFMALMAMAIVVLWFQNRQLQDQMLDRSDEYKDEIVTEIKRAYDPKFNEIKDTVLAKSSKLDTSIQEVNKFIDNANEQLQNNQK